MKAKSATLALAVFGLAIAPAAFAQNGAGLKLPRGFVYLSNLAPDIIEDMRYATARNFVGRRVPGYRANRCILALPVARALARVQRTLRTDGYSLKVYDCYRPARAVQAFVKWAARSKDGRRTKYYYPRINRSQIIPLGYVAERSSHSLGTAIDLTLVRSPRPKTGKRSKRLSSTSTTRSPASCIAPKFDRLPDTSIDMGTSWDCFDVLSHTRHRAVPPNSMANRRRLLSAMQSQGFRNYSREWWHFSMRVRGFYRIHDFPVK